MTFFPTLEQIVGHAPLLANLRRAMGENHPGHAHLYFGPPGIGKATVAAAFVQALFCRNKLSPDASGCGACAPCRKVAQGVHGDLIQVVMAEGKTRIGVDQVRQLAGFFSLTPLEAPWKVAIMDDAASMNEAAANALLKTLEEPPDRSLLILVTRQPGRLLPTIRSRCLKTRFSPLTQSEVRQILNTGPHAERVAALEESTLQEALLAGGGNVGRTLAFSQGELPALRKKFRQEIATLPSASLGQIITLAEQWGQPEKFALIAVLLRGWLQEHLRGTVPSGSGVGGRDGWLKAMVWIEQILRQAEGVNLNRRLVLEAIFIRLARLQGAAC
jgi:DNA polymerase-3 subunit delta'